MSERLQRWSRRRSVCPMVWTLGAASFISGCAASTGALEEEMSRLRRELHQTKKDLAENRLSVERLEGRVTLLSLEERPSVDRAAPAPIVDPEKRAASPRTRNGRVRVGAAGGNRRSGRVLPVVRLGGRVDMSERADSTVDPGAPDDGGPPVLLRLRGGDLPSDPSGDHDGDESPRERLSVDKGVLQKPDPILNHASSSALLEAEYDAAIEELRDRKHPRDALQLFQQFEARHPKSKLAGNAAYWVGECHYALADYSKAIQAFGRIERQYPRSSKIPDALFRSGETWLILKDVKKARQVFEEVIQLYPKSDASGRARAQLESAPEAEDVRRE